LPSKLSYLRTAIFRVVTQRLVEERRAQFPSTSRRQPEIAY
jgi:hypothetical protein